ncbi:MAG: purine-nucleoside phosphorylase [Candidatus Aminicenantes bacterium]|nr:purine-nucleoside phosphorylase [Candidatus Aminicenantes bacterium]NIM83067.1 purine-nucleoside phosphorylase [Candidatus Aminicenantes bacterium]NIN22446.1 purine-nucleoside phosphorylase [Candidatus Aminicenantes bacterium]NIN46214.1 purine-nucleoside phosphorylase [Candidatus Aminicenantes bacterium]NIN89051.1 purine-nucleoside phosphorylase [Candidatus Aminicenantes bacterium]
MNIFDQMNDAAGFIKSRNALSPEVGVILGSGLGEFADTLEEKTVIPYENIPHFKKVGVKGHTGQLVMGKIKGRPVAVMQGRYHYYEGHDIREVVFPVRVLCELGIKKLLLTNAAGGINSMLLPGDLMIIRDHINMMGVNPLWGENDERLGPRFPDMSRVYDEELINIIADAMNSMGLGVKKGVYLALSGPSYETPAEIKMLSVLGADAVGMSTVPEAIVARHMGAAVAGISCISNLAAGISKTPLSHKEVTETANRVKGHFIKLLTAIIPKF